MKIVACQKCGKEIEAERLSKKFCDDCREAVNKARSVESTKQWYEKHGVEYHKKWRDAHPEYKQRVIERVLKSDREHPERKRQRDALYYQRHKERISAQSKAYQQNNREKLRPHKQAALVRYRARKLQATGNWTAKQFKELCEQVDYHCAYCHKQFDRLTPDHIIPLSRGGSNDISNIIPACGPCNYSKQDKTPLEFLTKIRF